MEKCIGKKLANHCQNETWLTDTSGAWALSDSCAESAGR